jgi:hypothetical protein
MIDFSIQTGACKKFLESLNAGKSYYEPELIRNYPYYNYLLQSGMPNNFKYGKFGVLLSLFLGMIKKLDSSLTGYFDAFFYQLLKELDFEHNGLTIRGVEINELKSFLNTLSEVSGNGDLKKLNRIINISMRKGANLELNDLLGDIDMFLCHVIIRYNIEQILSEKSILSRINKFEINKILFVKYFPRTLVLLKDTDIIPSDFLFNNPLRLYYYCRSILKLDEDPDIVRVLELELKIFETKFFMEKMYNESFDLGELKTKINNRNISIPLKVNDTVTVIRDRKSSDVELEYWTGSQAEEFECDVLIYYDYANCKVRHHALTGTMAEIISFFRKGSMRKADYLLTCSDRHYAESKINELLFKTVLI